MDKDSELVGPFTIQKLEDTVDFGSGVVHVQDEDVLAVVQPLFGWHAIIFDIVVEPRLASGPDGDLVSGRIDVDLFGTDGEPAEDLVEFGDVLDEVWPVERWGWAA